MRSLSCISWSGRCSIRLLLRELIAFRVSAVAVSTQLPAQERSRTYRPGQSCSQLSEESWRSDCSRQGWEERAPREAPKTALSSHHAPGMADNCTRDVRFPISSGSEEMRLDDNDLHPDRSISSTTKTSGPADGTYNWVSAFSCPIEVGIVSRLLASRFLS